MKKIRVLVITHDPWSEDNNVGNSYSNIFKGMGDDIEFAHIYLRKDNPKNNLVKKYFHIPEQELIKSVFTRKDVGKERKYDDYIDLENNYFSNTYNKMRSLRWEIFLLGRDLGTLLGKWKTSKLDIFLEKFEPDIIFGEFSQMTIINELMVYSKKKTNASLVLYPWDDCYNYHKNSKDPFHFIRLFIERRYMRKTARMCDLMYTISEEMKEEYSKLFNKECHLLTKGIEINDLPVIKKNIDNPISLFYAGNIGDKRWQMLSYIATAIKKVNNELNTEAFIMNINTASPITNEIDASLNIKGVSKISGRISPEKVSDLLSSTDIAIHVESIDKEKLENCRLSFSTKLVDYFYHGNCILAVGGENSSMKYLKKNDAAIVVDDTSLLEDKLSYLYKNQDEILKFRYKSRQCGLENHNLEKIQKMILADFKRLIHLNTER